MGRDPRAGRDNQMSEDLVAYYRLRAAEYDNVYAKPERQDDIAALGERLSELLAGCRILELAAGTGFWTQIHGRARQEDSCHGYQ